jgi:hypothetical protein
MMALEALFGIEADKVKNARIRDRSTFNRTKTVNYKGYSAEIGYTVLKSSSLMTWKVWNWDLGEGEMVGKDFPSESAAEADFKKVIDTDPQ